MINTPSKQIIQNFIQVVWSYGDIDALKDFWTEDCINHAMLSDNNKGLEALRLYHASFLDSFSAFSDLQIELIQQIEESDRVVTHMNSTVLHSGTFMGIPATGRYVSLASIRIDRIQNGKIAEHWSIADVPGLMQQLQ